MSLLLPEERVRVEEDGGDKIGRGSANKDSRGEFTGEVGELEGAGVAHAKGVMKLEVNKPNGKMMGENEFFFEDFETGDRGEA